MPGFSAEQRTTLKYLIPGENVVVFSRFHWSVLAEPVITTLVGLVFVGTVAWDGGNRGVDVLWFAEFALMARLIWRLLLWRNDFFVATDRRLLRVYGFLVRRVAMVPLVKLTDLTYLRSVPGRLLGYGTFVLESAGQDQAMRRLDHITRPDRTYQLVMEQIFRRDEDDLGETTNDPATDDDDPTGPIQMAPWPWEAKRGSAWHWQRGVGDPYDE